MVTTEDLAGAASPESAVTPAPGPPGPARRLQVWRSPEGQPAWARPVLLLIAAMAAFAYAYGMAGDTLETFYGGAVRSMSESWHNFFFASFDPWGTVSIDKLPGAFWVQALSVRLFGFHIWAFVLPQVVEGTLSVLLLYRIVRRVAGPGAGLVAAVILAVSPATVLLDRGNISDTLLILLLLLATNATLSAIETGNWRSLVAAGVWVGLAFQTKMLQSWLVLPGLFIAYLVAAPAPALITRLRHVILAGLAVLVVSLSWMTVVTLVPAHDRPYVDGSCDNSVFSQVFLYNGLDRSTGNVLTQAGCRPESPVIHAIAVHLRTLNVGSVAVPGGPSRFLSGPFGRLAAWLFFPSMVAALGLCIIRRKKPRTDPVQASVFLWLAWLVLTWSSFASSQSLNSYYLAALIPPIAALCGMGLSAAWRHRDSATVRAVLMATVAGGAAYAMALIPRTAGVWGLVLASTAGGAIVALGLLAASLRWTSRWLLPAGFIVSSATLLLGPCWASGTAVAAHLDPFETPYQSAPLSAYLATANQDALALIPERDAAALRFLSSQAIDTTESSDILAFDVFATGREYLALGGFTGRVPSPTMAAFIADVAHGRVDRVAVGVTPLTNNPELLWVRAHCQKVPGIELANGVGYQPYTCSPADAR
jgi:4-amino-4-deoxy-L-arabinose transferase-like glycosyltransferase